MKICSALLLLALFGSAYSNNLFNKRVQREVRKNRWGGVEIIDHDDKGFNKEVLLPSKNYVRDYTAQTEFLKQAIQQVKINEENIKTGNVYTCSDKPNPTGVLEFFPVYVGDIGGQKQHDLGFNQGRCFEDIQFQYAHLGDGADLNEVTLTITASGQKSYFCRDIFFFGTTEFVHVEDITEEGTHTIKFKNFNQYAVRDIGKNGIKVYMFCAGYIETFEAVWKTLQAFIGGLSPDPDTPIIGSHVPPYMEAANVEFLKETMGYILEVRETEEVEIDPNYIQSGDFIAIMRLDGLDPMIMYGTGGTVGHTVMALRMDGELYIVESQDGWYWPNSGIQKNKWADWIKYARNADFNLVHMPLSDEARAKFNETAVIEFFKETEGLPYGYHNFLFGWVDTPEDNFPPLIPHKLMPIFFSMLEKILPEEITTLYVKAMNKRLDTTGLNIEQLSAVAAERNMTLMQVQSIPETEGWIYDGIEPRDGLAYVCSAYVIALYKRSGVLGDHIINSPEFTPRDIYTLNIWNTTKERPEACVKADPNEPFCQILGKYRMKFPGLNTIAPYDHMAERCPSLPPNYYRPADC